MRVENFRASGHISAVVLRRSGKFQKNKPVYKKKIKHIFQKSIEIHPKRVQGKRGDKKI